MRDVAILSLHGLATLVGSSVLFVGLHAVSPVRGNSFGLVLLAVIAMLCALFVLPVMPIALTGSPWRVPRTWGNKGIVPYATLFGLALGTGVMTALTSPGFYALVFATLVTGDPMLPLVLATLFALGRWLTVATTSLAISTDRQRIWLVDRVAKGANNTLWLEGVLLAFSASIVFFAKI